MKPLEEVLQNWEAAISLEVSIELSALKTKMFCGCALDYNAQPNTHTCPVCLGLPGALPAPNRAAIEAAILAGLATHCDIEKNALLYRKYCMHPAVPNNYQTIQTFPAFCTRGHIDINVSLASKSKGTSSISADDIFETSVGEETHSDENEQSFRIGVERICIEAAKGKIVPVTESDGVEKDNEACDVDRCLVDYNRAGAPLLKLITGPDLQTPEQACLFVQKVWELCSNLGIVQGLSGKEDTCCSALVSLRRHGCKEFGTAVKLVGICVLDDLRNALTYEICRQTEILECGDGIGEEVRFWNTDSQSAVVRCDREFLDDFRVYPDPDIAAFCLSDEYIEGLRARL